VHYAELVQQTINLNDAAAVIDLMQRAAECMLNDPQRRGCAVRLQAKGRLLATGDLHDNTIHLKKITTFARLDESLNHHVVLHELIHGDQLINGLDFSYRMLARVAELVVQYPEQVHPLLANHEMSQLTGSGVSKGAGNSVALFEDALEYVFGDGWESVAEAIAVFFRAMPIALLSEAGVCCAHSLPNELMMKRFDMHLLDRALVEEDYHGSFGSAYLMCWGRAYSTEQARRLAEHWNVKLFVLGHQHVPDGFDIVGQQIIVLNSDHQRAACLPIDLARVPDAHGAALLVQPLVSMSVA
jgi:hypothetical protein